MEIPLRLLPKEENENVKFAKLKKIKEEYMDKTIYVINCHGKSDLSKRFYIPENTYIITLNKVGTRLLEQREFFWDFSDKISLDPPLFLNNYESKKLSSEGKDLQDFLSTHELFENEEDELILRNHLPGDNMTDIILTFNEPNETLHKFFNVSKKSPDDPIPIRNFTELKDVYLSDYIKTNGPGVYVLLVCRSLPNYKYFLNLYKRDVYFKTDVNIYLHASPERRIELKKDLEEYPKILLSILDELTKHQIKPDQVIDFLTEPPQLKVARIHSNVTDEVEHTISQRKHVHTYYYDQMKVLVSHVDDIEKEIKTFIDPKKKDLPNESINSNGKIVITDQTNTKGLMDCIVQIEDRFYKSKPSSSIIKSFLSVFDPLDQPFLYQKIEEIKMVYDEMNKLKEKIDSLPNDTVTRQRAHDVVESRTVPDSLDSLDSHDDSHWLMTSYKGGKRKTKRKKINNFLKSVRYNR